MNGAYHGEDTDASQTMPPPPTMAPGYRFKFNFSKLMKFMGPGWVMSLAYLDPGNLEGVTVVHHNDFTTPTTTITKYHHLCRRRH